MRMTIRTKGMEEIRDALNLLPREVAGEHLHDVALEGAEVVRAEAEANARKHKRTGELAGDIHVEVAKESVGVRAVVHIGPGKKTGWRGRLLELGHAIVVGGRRRSRGQPGRVVGQVPPHPWLRPALDTKRREAQQVMIAAFQRRLSRVWRRR